MLQLSYVAQKRHLYWISARFKYPIRQTTPPLPPCLSPSYAHAKSSSTSSAHSHRKGIKPSESVFQNLPKEVLAIVEDLRMHRSQANMLQSIKISPKLSAFFATPRKIYKLVDAFARSSTPTESLEVLKLAHSLGNTLKHQAYEAACFHLGASKHWHSLLAVAHCAQMHLNSTSVRLLNWRATALMETGQYALLHEIMEEFEDANIAPNQRTYHLMLTGCIRNHDLEGSRRCLRDMREAGFSPNATTQILISKSYRQFGADIEVYRNAISGLPKLKPAGQITVINNLLQYSLEHLEFSIVSQVLAMFDERSSNIFASSMSRVYDHGTSAKRETFFPVASGKVKPNSDTFAIFMNHQIRASQPEAAIRLWKIAAASGLSATPNVLAALIHAYFRQGYGNTAIRMVAELSVYPRATEFDSLMVDPIHEDDLPPLNLTSPSLTVRICNVLLKAILERQGLAPVPIMFAIMHANGLKPNGRTLELLLGHMSHKEEPRPRTLFQLARTLISTDDLSPRHMHHIISCVLRDEKRSFVDSAWKKRLPRHRLVKEHRQRVRLLQLADVFDPTAGLKFSKHLSYDRMSRPILRSLTARQVKSDPPMNFLRMRRDAALHLDTDSALEVFRILLARGLRINEYHYNALLEGYALSGEFNLAQEVMDTASKAGIAPSLVMYTTLIAAYAKHRDPESAKQTFKKMVSAGIRPDVPSIDALVSAFFAARKYRTARRLLIKLWPYVQPFPEALQGADMHTLAMRFRQLHPYRSRGVQFPKPKRHTVYADIKRLLRAHKRYFMPHVSDLLEQDKIDAVPRK